MRDLWKTHFQPSIGFFGQQPARYPAARLASGLVASSSEVGKTGCQKRGRDMPSLHGSHFFGGESSFPFKEKHLPFLGGDHAWGKCMANFYRISQENGACLITCICKWQWCTCPPLGALEIHESMSFTKFEKFSILWWPMTSHQADFASDQHIITRWWFQIVLIFTPSWRRFPIWLILFQMGWNHQLDKYDWVHVNKSCLKPLRSSPGSLVVALEWKCCTCVCLDQRASRAWSG